MKPNWFCTFVTDTQRSTAFYNDLFDMEPSFVEQTFVTYSLEGGVQFALWSSHGVPTSIDAPRMSEMGIFVDNRENEIERLWQVWREKAPVLQELQDMGFGSTFVIADPDGNRIRVSPED